MTTLESVPALLAEVERLTQRNAALEEQLRLANQRAESAQLECGRLNASSARRVDELQAEVERLAQSEQQARDTIAALRLIYRQGSMSDKTRARMSEVFNKGGNFV